MLPIVINQTIIDAETRDSLRNLSRWPPQVRLTDGATSERPSFGVSGSITFTSSSYKLHKVWKGSRDGIYWSQLEGNLWTPQQRIPGIGSSKSPGLTTIYLEGNIRQGLLMAWKGVHDNQALFFSQNHGSGWTPQREIVGSGSSHRPALAGWGGGAYMAWKGIRNSQAIFWSQFNGKNWAQQKEIRGVGTSDSPALVIFNNRLYMFWKGVKGDSGIYYSTLDNSRSNAIWRPQERVRFIDSASSKGWTYPGTTHGISATVLDNGILLAWKGVKNDRGIYISFFDGTEFTAQIRIPNVGTTQGPGIYHFNGVTYMGWKGLVRDNKIYWLAF